jgi:hypothetical protein
MNTAVRCTDLVQLTVHVLTKLPLRHFLPCMRKCKQFAHIYVNCLIIAGCKFSHHHFKVNGKMPLESIWSDARAASLLEAFAVSTRPNELANVLFWIDLERVLFGLSILWHQHSIESNDQDGDDEDKATAAAALGSRVVGQGPFAALLDLKRCYFDESRAHKATAMTESQRVDALASLEKALAMNEEGVSDRHEDSDDQQDIRVAVSKLEHIQGALVRHMQVSP